MDSEKSNLLSVKESNTLLSQYKEYVMDIEYSLERNPNKAIEACKGLLDSICKTILRDLGTDFDKGWDTPKLVKETLNNLPFLKTLQMKDFNSAKKIINSIITLSYGICEFRNSHSFITHGQDIQEEYCEKLYGQLVFDAVKTVSNFILEIHTNLTSISDKVRIRYEDHDDFNNYYDELYGEVVLGNYIFPASQILYTDREAYKEALNEFRSMEEKD